MKETDPPEIYDCKMLHREGEGELRLIQEQKLRLCRSVTQQEVRFPTLCKLLRLQKIQEVML